MLTNRDLKAIDERIQYWAEILVWAFAITIDNLKGTVMASLADVLAAEAEVSAEIGQVLSKLAEDTTLIQQLQDTIAAGGLSPEAQAQVDDLLSQITANRDQITTALNPPTP